MARQTVVPCPIDARRSTKLLVVPMLDLEFVVLLVVRRGGVFKKARTDDPTPPTRRGEATNDPDDYTVIVSGAALSPGHFIRQSA